MKKILVKGPVSAFIPGYDDMMQSIRVIGSRHMPTVERPLPLTEHNYEFEQQAAEAGSDALPGALETFHSDKPIQGTWVSPPSLQSLAFPDLQGSTTQPVNLVGILDEQPHWSAGPKQRRLAHEGFTYGGHKRDLFRNIPLPKGTQQGALQYGALGALLERGIDPLTLGHKGGYASLSGHRIPTEEEVKRYLRTFTDTQKVRDALLRTGMPAKGGIEMWGMPKVKDMADLKRISSAYPNVFGLNERTLRSLPMDDAWSELLKGQDFHPSVQGYLENPEGAESFRMDPENPGQELPIPSQVAVQQPLENNFEGSFDESFWSNHAHDRVTDSGRIASEREKDEVQQRITDALRPYLNEYGYYKKDSPQSFAIRTHILDSHRDSATHGKNIRGDSNGDSIVGIVHPDRQDSRKPKLTTVYLRRSELAPLHGKSPQLFRVNKTGGAGKGIRVDKVINNHNLSKREFKMRLKQAKLLGGKRASEPMDLSWRMLKAQQTIDAYSQENIKEGFDPETQNVIIASKPGAKNISAEEQSRLHDEMLRRISELEGTENMRIMSARGRSEEWGDENAFMLSNVPDDVMPKIHSLAEEFGQESILHSPKGMAGTQFVDSEGEVTGGLEEGEFTRRKPANFTEFPTGQKYAYGDYVAASEPMNLSWRLLKDEKPDPQNWRSEGYPSDTQLHELGLADLERLTSHPNPRIRHKALKEQEMRAMETEGAMPYDWKQPAKDLADFYGPQFTDLEEQTLGGDFHPEDTDEFRHHETAGDVEEVMPGQFYFLSNVREKYDHLKEVAPPHIAEDYAQRMNEFYQDMTSPKESSIIGKIPAQYQQPYPTPKTQEDVMDEIGRITEATNTYPGGPVEATGFSHGWQEKNASEPMPIGDVLVKYDFYHDKKRSGVQGVHYPPSRLDFTPIKGRKNEWGTSENAPALQESGKNKRIDPTTRLTGGERPGHYVGANIAILNPHPSMQEGQAFDQTAQWLGRNLLHEGVHSLIHDEVSEAATTPQQYTNMTEWGAHQAMFPGGQDQADLANRLYASHPHTTNVVKSDVLVKMPQEARNYATQIHEGQMYGEQPYMTHVEDVASRFDDPHLQRIAYLHDVVEDSETGIDEIHERFGEDIGHAVDALTRRKDEQYFDYINRVKEHPEATQVKLADLHSNLKNNPNESLARRYEKAIQMLKHDILVKERVSPEAKRHKLEYDTAYEASPERRKYRADLNRERRRRGMYGDHSGRDISHTEGGKLTVEGAHENRARHFKDQGTLRHVAIEKAIPPEILLGGAGVGMTMAKLARLVAVMQAKEKAKNNERMQNLVGVAPSATPPDMAVDEPHDS